ncbi:MAG: peptidoglycan-binding domain-containing protein [Candidatus Taylorbacteria bacterium]
MKLRYFTGLFAMAAITLAVVFNVTPKLVIAADEASDIAPVSDFSTGAEPSIPAQEVIQEPAATLPVRDVATDPGSNLVPRETVDTGSGSSIPNSTVDNSQNGGMPNTQFSSGYEGVVAPVQAPSEPEQPAIIPAVTPSVVTGGGSSSGSSGSYSLLSFTSGTSSCPLITSYLKFGANNNASEVAKLQSFLKNTQGINVIVNGIFDLQTENAVKIFQSRYFSDIMGPWSSQSVTGNMYITTKNKINQIACSKPFALSAAELAVINAYRNRQNQTPAQTPVRNVVKPVVNGPAIEEASTSEDVGLNTGTTQTASVVNASILSRFWDFVVGMFR